MKVIDILNKRANGEEIPKKIKYADVIYVLNVYTDAIERLYVWENDNDIGWFEREYFTLHSEVEVIEDDEDEIKKLRKEIEELNTKLDEHIKDLFSHNGSSVTIKAIDANKISSSYIYDTKGVMIGKNPEAFKIE